MQTFIFTWKVFPNNQHEISYSNELKTSYLIGPINELLVTSVDIKNSLVTTTCEVKKYNPDNLGWYLNYAIDMTRTIVQSIGFLMGVNFDIYFDTVIDPLGTSSSIKWSYSFLTPLCTSLNLNDAKKFNRALNHICEEPNLFLAISEILPALRDGSIDVTGCQRAIERIRNLLSPDEKNESKAWKCLHKTLNTSKNFLTPVYSDKIAKHRHGHLSPLSWEEKKEALTRSWILIDRYIAYKMCDSQSLSLKDFPNLD